MSWTDERVTTLKALYADGLPASQIAAELGGITRNSVIGKARRLGLTRTFHLSPLGGAAKRHPKHRKPPKPPKPTPERRDRFRPAKALRLGDRGWQAGARVTELPEPAPAPVADEAIPPAQRRTLMELDGTTCRYPIGDPQLEDFFFCGAEPIAGSVYCGQHHRLCNQGSPPPRPFIPMRGSGRV